MLSQRARSLLSAADCDTCFDELTRQLYATDASIYRVVPAGVAFPRSEGQAQSIVRAAAEAGVAIIPRGAGSGLVGGAIGDGLVVDFSRHPRRISGLDLERRTVRVEAGVVLDQLNAYLKPHGFCFGPDVATSSRATLGGMIANNSSGARVPMYGTTADHVISLRALLADGRVVDLGGEGGGLAAEAARIAGLLRPHREKIAERMPAGLLKRWPGYALDRAVGDPENLVHLLCGSEGTLAAILSADLKILPLPARKGLGLVFFASVEEAMQATVELLPLKPVAIEHIDRILFDQTRGKLAFAAARELLQLEQNGCESILLVEFYDEADEKLDLLTGKKLGLRSMVLTSSPEMNLVWGLRKAGLSILTGRPGPAKPVTAIEDTAVRPEQLPAYVSGLKSILKPLGVEACYYGHAAAGLLHVRPVLDLHDPADLKKLRLIGDQVSALVRQFGGSLAGEHGVGMARTEYLLQQLGPELTGLMREIKICLDPKQLFNPGKVVDTGRHRLDAELRLEPGRRLEIPFEPELAFAAKDRSFVGNLEQCNGCGGCRKDAPTMCPTFMATGEEIMSTRGRANTIRAALTRQFSGGTVRLDSPELELALGNCLSCKACTTECPSNVNMALLKAELLQARHRRHGLSLRARVVTAVDLLGRLGCLAPGAANALLEAGWSRWLMEKTLGISRARPLPHYATERFDRWFGRRQREAASARGKVLLWDDTFVRYNEPHIGKACVRVLEAAGLEVSLVQGRRCCGRPAFSQGNLDAARSMGRHNLALLKRTEPDTPIIFLEPSCYAMFAEDYEELKLPHAREIAQRCWLFENFVEHALSLSVGQPEFQPKVGAIAIHAHCHAKALTDITCMSSLARRLPGRTVAMLDTGCCGMAGAFGTLQSKYDLSMRVGQMLADRIREQPPGATIVASGTSCRQQIEHLTGIRPRHMAEVLAEALDK